MQFALHDPRTAGVLILALLATATFVIPGFMLEVLLTIAMSAVLAPAIAWLRKRLHLSTGLTVALIAFAIIAGLGIGGYYGGPLFVRGISETLAQLPDSVRKLAPFVHDWLEAAKVRLEGLFPAGEDPLEDFMRKLPELAKGQGGGIAKLALATVFGSVAAIGHFLLFLVLTAILSGEWDKNTERAHYLVGLFAPRQQQAVLSFGEKFQRYGLELFNGIFTVMLIFMPIFFALLYFYGHLSLGKSMLFGVILGATSAIPTIGGILTYLILVVVGILNFGLEYEALKTTFVLYVAAFVIHFAETKFVTPRVLGHRISFTSFAVIAVLVGSVLALGISKGILTGLFLLVALKSLVEVADEGRRIGAGAVDAPPAVLAASMDPQPPAASAATPPPERRLSMGDKKRRR